MSLMEKIFGDLNEKEVKKVSRIADKVMAYDEEMQKLTDQQLRDKTAEFRERIASGETLDQLLPEAFAVCREDAWRSLGMKHFYVQVIGGIELHFCRRAYEHRRGLRFFAQQRSHTAALVVLNELTCKLLLESLALFAEIGRASCRERV